MIAEVKLESK